MNKNMGMADRVIRILAAALIITLYFTGIISGYVAVALIIVAGIIAVTSLAGFCPLYLPFRIKTNRDKASNSSH